MLDKILLKETFEVNETFKKKKKKIESEKVMLIDHDEKPISAQTELVKVCNGHYIIT